MAENLKADQKTQLALDLGHAMHELRMLIRHFIQTKIKEHNIDITFEMLEVMSVLWKRDGRNQQEIADLTLRDKSSMTYLIDNLVKRKLVKRVEDEKDRRNKLIFLTEDGNRVKEQLYPWVTEEYIKATATLRLEDLQSSVNVLKEMIDNLKKVEV
ncbi:MarR family transcriptional regulator [Mucilaginibacter sp. Bleaf8]|uniref:MarR family winged helix-turn-helix transcriptional regulator n=1 Tax=Mucilaginibacter sp. Bleaf8 TaxID=2834430 RepID=UPI001BCAF572|nr:MarR family transcriptional regulator [Mucilaginibacter sp. Bleaf8]MBS7566419.1 MarR family transcriptional regulator [Mucilaginibacter sp. Bleaf8]